MNLNSLGNASGSHGTPPSLEQPESLLHAHPAPILAWLLELPGSGAAWGTMVGPAIADLPLQMVLVSAEDTLKPARVYI